MQLPEIATRMLIEFSGTALVATNTAYGLTQLNATFVMELIAGLSVSFLYSVSLIAFKGDYASGFNPAVTLGSLVAPGRSSFDILSFLTFLVAQFAGALFGFVLARALYLPYDVRDDPYTSLISMYRFAPDEFGLFAIHWALESLATAGVVLLFLRYTHSTGKLPMLAPIYVGVVYFVPAVLFRIFASVPGSVSLVSMAITMNPALVFASICSRKSSSFSHSDSALTLFFYWGCHLTGSILGAVLWRVLLEDEGMSKLPPFKPKDQSAKPEQEMSEKIE